MGFNGCKSGDEKTSGKQYSLGSPPGEPLPVPKCHHRGCSPSGSPGMAGCCCAHPPWPAQANPVLPGLLHLPGVSCAKHLQVSILAKRSCTSMSYELETEGRAVRSISILNRRHCKGSKRREKRAAVTTSDSQRPSPALAVTVAPDASGRRRSDWDGDDEEQSHSSWLPSKRKGSSQASDAEGKGQRSSSTAAPWLLLLYFAKTLEYSRARHELLPLKPSLMIIKMKCWGTRAKQNLSFTQCGTF